MNYSVCIGQMQMSRCICLRREPKNCSQNSDSHPFSRDVFVLLPRHDELQLSQF